MSSLASEVGIFTVPDGSILSPKTDEVSLRKGTFVNVDVTGAINGQPVSGSVVFANSTQTLKNKSLEDSSTYFVDAADATIRARVDAAGSAGTTAVLTFAQTSNRTYTVPDSGADCFIVTTEGAQTVNGAKTFANLTATTFSTNTVNEIAAGGGVSINGAVKIYAGDTTSTVNATTSTVKSIPTSTNTAYYITAEVVGANSAGDTGTFRSRVKAKNVGGVLTLGSPHDTWEDPDSAISTASMSFSTSGTSVIVRVTGVAAQTINWKCRVDVTYLAF